MANFKSYLDKQPFAALTECHTGKKLQQQPVTQLAPAVQLVQLPWPVFEGSPVVYVVVRSHPSRFHPQISSTNWNKGILAADHGTLRYTATHHHAPGAQYQTVAPPRLPLREICFSACSFQQQSNRSQRIQNLSCLRNLSVPQLNVRPRPHVPVSSNSTMFKRIQKDSSLCSLPSVCFINPDKLWSSYEKQEPL